MQLTCAGVDKLRSAAPANSPSSKIEGERVSGCRAYRNLQVAHDRTRMNLAHAVVH